MLTRIDSFFIDVVAPDFFQIELTRQFPQGTDVQATICLSSLQTSLPILFNPDPHFDVVARIVSWAVHLTGGGEGPRIFASSSNQNAVSVKNCARITFSLFASRAAAKAQINVFSF